MKGLIPYDNKKKNIKFGDRILVWTGLDYDNYGKVYHMKRVDMLNDGTYLVFGIYCKNIPCIIYPSLYLDRDMKPTLYIKRPLRKRLFYNLFG